MFPGLATADCLQALGVSVQWLGTRQGIEASLVPAAGIPISYLKVSGLRGKGIWPLLKAPFQLSKAIIEALLVVRRLSPHCVLGMGGFASGPGGIAAWLLGKPLVIHEQNAVAGTTNRILALFASRVMEAFPSAFRQSEKVMRTGNPIRSTIGGSSEPEATNFLQKRPLRLLVLGGSLGAKAINDILPPLFTSMDKAQRPELWHQVGKAHIKEALDSYQRMGLDVKVEPFIEDMSAAYCWADLVLCRAGALTVSELAAAGRGAILIPFPFAIDDHQTKNARWLVDNNAGILLEQRVLSIDLLRDTLVPLIEDRSLLFKMACNAHQLAMPDAAQLVANACLEVAHD